MLNCSAGLSSTISSRLRRGVGILLDAGQSRSKPFGVVGLVTKENAPRARPWCRSSSSVSICTGMCRVVGILLQMIEHRPAQHVGQEYVQRYGRGMEFTSQRKRFRAARRHQNLEPFVVRQIAQDARIVRIVFHDQQNGVVRLADSRDRPRICSTARSDDRRWPVEPARRTRRAFRSDGTMPLEGPTYVCGK